MVPRPDPKSGPSMFPVSLERLQFLPYRGDMTSATIPAVNPHDDSFYQNPFPSYSMLRAEAPIYEIPDTPGLFFVTTWPYVREALMDPGLFSNLMPHARRTEPPAEVADAVAEIRSKGYPYTPALGNNDAPEHTRYRKLVNRSFTVRSLNWMEPLVDEVADQIAAQLTDGEVIDAVENISVPLPVWAIMRILGIEDKYRDDLRRWSDSSNASLGGKLTADRWIDVENDILEFQTVICEILDDRRANPREDLLGQLVTAVEGETPLTNQELVWLVRELIVAGNETTIRSMSEILCYLDDMRATDPAIWDRVRDDEAFRKGVVEEGIRMAAPVMGLWRRVTRDVDFHGVHLPAESTIFLAYSSANRDESVFPDADTFDPLRENVKEHLSFGHGIHVCVGAGLARIEASSALRALAENVTALEVVDRSQLRYGPSYGLRGLLELPVRVVHR